MKKKWYNLSPLLLLQLMKVKDNIIFLAINRPSERAFCSCWSNNSTSSSKRILLKLALAFWFLIYSWDLLFLYVELTASEFFSSLISFSHIFYKALCGIFGTLSRRISLYLSVVWIGGIASGLFSSVIFFLCSKPFWVATHGFCCYWQAFARLSAVYGGTYMLNKPECKVNLSRCFIVMKVWPSYVRGYIKPFEAYKLKKTFWDSAFRIHSVGLSFSIVSSEI